MPFSEMLRRVALVRTDVSEDTVTNIGELKAMLALSSNRGTLPRNFFAACIRTGFLYPRRQHFS
jgi:hypothetical protein